MSRNPIGRKGGVYFYATYWLEASSDESISETSVGHINMDLEEIWFKIVDYIHMADDR
jgi:hypothetical protein